jgi:anti-sigma factor RsiW
MKGCPEWESRLLDFALGGLRDSEARAMESHVAICPACGGALARLRERAGDLDAAVRQLVREQQSSPSFVEGLSTRLKASRESPMVAARWNRPAWALGILILAAILLFSSGKRQPAQKDQISFSDATLSTWRSPTEGLLQPSAGEVPEYTPRLGEFYFPLDSRGKGKKNGGNKNES